MKWHKADKKPEKDICVLGILKDDSSHSINPSIPVKYYADIVAWDRRWKFWRTFHYHEKEGKVVYWTYIPYPENLGGQIIE